MAQPSQETEEKRVPFIDPSEFAAIEQSRMEELGSVQSELFRKFQDANRQWLERFQAEVNLSADYGSQFMRATSLPEAMDILQRWSSRRFEMMAEDGKRLLDDTRKFLETGAHLANSWLAKVPGITS